MSFRRIEYFLSVAKHLNFTKAARECYVAQAAISQQIKQFEEELLEIEVPAEDYV